MQPVAIQVSCDDDLLIGRFPEGNSLKSTKARIAFEVFAQFERLFFALSQLRSRRRTASGSRNMVNSDVGDFFIIEFRPQSEFFNGLQQRLPERGI